MEVAASSLSSTAPQNLEAAFDALAATHAFGQQDQGAPAQQEGAAGNGGTASSASALKERLPAPFPNIALALQAKPQAQAAPQPAQVTPQTTGTIGPDPGYLSSLKGIAQSNQSLSDKLKMAWDTTQYYWRNADTAQGATQTIGGNVAVDASGCFSTQGGPKICVGPASIEGTAAGLVPAAERIAGRILAPGVEEAGAGVSKLATQGGANVGSTFGKLGTVVENPGIAVEGFTGHGIDQVISRGVPPVVLQNTINAPVVVLQQSSGRYLYVSEQAAAVVSPSGQVITTYPSSMFDAPIKNLLKAVGK